MLSLITVFFQHFSIVWLSYLGLALMTPFNWTITLLVLAPSVAIACGILLKYRAARKYMADSGKLWEDMKFLVIFAVFGMFMAFLAGWNVSRLVMR